MKKYIVATQDRPEGDVERPIIDFKEYVDRIEDEGARNKKERNGITVFKTSNISVELVAMQKNARMQLRLSEGVMSIQVMEGEVQFATIKGIFRMKKDQIVIVNKCLLYSVEVIGEAILLLTLANF